MEPLPQMPVLWADDAWMTLAVIRTREMQSCENGYPQSLVHYFTVAEAASPAWLHGSF